MAYNTKGPNCDIRTGPNGMRFRRSNSGNLMIVTEETAQHYSQRFATGEEARLIGADNAHHKKAGPPLSCETRREVEATEAMIRAQQNAPIGSTDEEVDEIGHDAFEDVAVDRAEAGGK